MSKHTGSSWRLIDVLSCVTVFAGNPEKVIARFDSPSQEDRANARLIAAAPDMLEALLNMVEWHGKREWPTAEFKVESLLPIDLQNDEVRLAMRAIAKATGEA